MRPDTLATGLPKGAWARFSTARVRATTAANKLSSPDHDLRLEY